MESQVCPENSKLAFLRFGPVLPVILHVGSNGVHVSAFVARIVVTDIHNKTLEVDVLSLIRTVGSLRIGVDNSKHGLDAKERSIANQAEVVPSCR